MKFVGWFWALRVAPRVTDGWVRVSGNDKEVLDGILLRDDLILVKEV